MHAQEPLPTEYPSDPVSESAGSVTRHVGWTLFGSAGGRTIAVNVCRFMSRRAEGTRGAPTIQSQNGAVRLWRIEVFSEISWSPAAPWLLRDGVTVQPSDPVLELHIAGERFMELIQQASWRNVIAREFGSMVPLLLGRDEVALVGSTILRRQVLEFGATLRELPPGLRRSLDTFYRRLILLAFHPAGAKRVLSEREPVAEAAISRQEFCRRYQNAGASS